MRFWLLKQIARCMGLKVQMLGCRLSHPTVIVLATDEYAAVEAIHILSCGFDLDDRATGTLH